MRLLWFLGIIFFTAKGCPIACPEEIAYRMGLINEEQLEKIAKPMVKTDMVNTC